MQGQKKGPASLSLSDHNEADAYREQSMASTQLSLPRSEPQALEPDVGLYSFVIAMLPCVITAFHLTHTACNWHHC